MDLKEDYTDKKTGLTEKEQYFLDILFDECKGDVRKAMDASGYDRKTPSSLLRLKLKDQIKDAAEAYMASNTAKAAIALSDVLDDPTLPGATNLIKASKEVLDRTGITAPEQKERVVERNIFILPAKGTMNATEEAGD